MALASRLRAKIRRHLSDSLYSQTGSRFCSNYNIVSKVYWKSPVVLSWDERRSKILVTDGTDHIYIARPTRACRYRRGITAKLDSLAGEYLLGRIDFHDGDCIVDCGANVGEVGMWLKRRHKNLTVLSVEPEEAEADCCDLNVYDGAMKTIRNALWKEVTDLTFYSQNSSGDSSIFEIEEFEATRTVHATTLSSLLSEHSIGVVKLLKLESEGAEPEILAGADDCLSRIEYIAADLGPERGMLHETTVSAVTNLLLSRNFSLIDLHHDRFTFLFKNRAFP